MIKYQRMNKPACSILAFIRTRTRTTWWTKSSKRSWINRTTYWWKYLHKWFQKVCSLFIYLHFELLHSKPPEHKQLDEQNPKIVPEFAGQLEIFNVIKNSSFKHNKGLFVTCIFHFYILNHLNIHNLMNKILQDFQNSQDN